MATVKLEFILFGALLQQPQTGYELQRFMDAAGRFIRANTSMTQVYRSLRTMEERGWLTHDIEPKLGAQDAKRYRLTPDGQEAFYGWLREPYEPGELPDASFAAQLRYRAQYRGRDAAIDVLDAEIAHRRRQITRNRDRDRTEWYDPDAPIDVELTNTLMEWEHRRGADFMDRHVAACIELRDQLATDALPSDDRPTLLQPFLRDDPSDEPASPISTLAGPLPDGPPRSAPSDHDDDTGPPQRHRTPAPARPNGRRLASGPAQVPENAAG